MLLTFQLTALGYLVWKCAGIMDGIATQKQILLALAASNVQSRQLFASTPQEQLFELKNEDSIKNSGIYATHVLSKCYPSTQCMARSNFITFIPRRKWQLLCLIRVSFEKVKIQKT
jgi:hypothetical protein